MVQAPTQALKDTSLVLSPSAMADFGLGWSPLSSTLPTRMTSCEIKVFVRFRPLNMRELRGSMHMPGIGASPTTRQRSQTLGDPSRRESDSSRRDSGLFRKVQAQALNLQGASEPDFDSMFNIEYIEENAITITSGGDGRTFSYDKVFGPSSKQVDLFQSIGGPQVKDVLEGFNGTIFAYGQTGAGKSFTMLGGDVNDEDSRGIIPRCSEAIFAAIDADEKGLEFTIKCSFCELYMERINDLLEPGNRDLRVQETPLHGVRIVGITEEYVTSSAEVLSLLNIGEKMRAVSATQMNNVSSRSHCIFTVSVESKDEMDSVRSGRLFLVDLAGCEKVSKTGAEGETLAEANKINQSLTTLARCINELTKKKATHIPYRDSKLTRILQDSLGGNSKTSLIVNCSPHASNCDETLSSLAFGSRAKTIKNKVKANEIKSVAELNSIIMMLKKQLSVYVPEVGVNPLDRSGSESSFSSMEPSATGNDNPELQSRLHVLQEELRAREAEIATGDGEHRALLKEYDDLKEENGLYMELVQSLQTEHEVSLNESEENVSKLTKALESVKASLQIEVSRTQTLEEEISVLHEKQQAALERCKLAEEKATSLEVANKFLSLGSKLSRQKRQHAEEQLEKLQLSASGIVSWDQESMQAKLEAALSEKHEKEQEIRQLEAAAISDSQRLGQLEAELSDIRGQYEESLTLVSSTQSKHDSCLRALEESRQSETDLRATVTELQDKCTKLNDDLHTVQELLQATQEMQPQQMLLSPRHPMEEDVPTLELELEMEKTEAETELELPEQEDELAEETEKVSDDLPPSWTPSTGTEPDALMGPIIQALNLKSSQHVAPHSPGGEAFPDRVGDKYPKGSSRIRRSISARKSIHRRESSGSIPLTPHHHHLQSAAAAAAATDDHSPSSKHSHESGTSSGLPPLGITTLPAAVQRAAEDRVFAQRLAAWRERIGQCSLSAAMHSDPNGSIGLLIGICVGKLNDLQDKMQREITSDNLPCVDPLLITTTICLGSDLIESNLVGMSYLQEIIRLTEEKEKLWREKWEQQG